MKLWISLPSAFVPGACAAPDNVEVDEWYRRICLAFAHPGQLQKDTFILPRALAMDAEDLAACAITPALTSLESNKPLVIDLLVDCRSSAAIGGSAPTYRLAAKANLRNSLPFSLSGQAGSEVAQAVYFASQLLRDTTGVAMISAVQRIVPPDGRVNPDRFPHADASAAIIVSPFQMQAKCFQVLSIALGQLEHDSSKGELAVMKQAIDQAQLTRHDIKWTITHRFSERFDRDVKCCLPDATLVIRERYPDFNFGCADPLISLHSVFSERTNSLDGVGLVWFRGMFGAIAAALLNVMN